MRLIKSIESHFGSSNSLPGENSPEYSARDWSSRTRPVGNRERRSAVSSGRMYRLARARERALEL